MAIHVSSHPSKHVFRWYEDLVVQPSPDRLQIARAVLQGIMRYGDQPDGFPIHTKPGIVLAKFVSGDPRFRPYGMTDDQLELMRWCADLLVQNHPVNLEVFIRTVGPSSSISGNILTDIYCFCTPSGDDHVLQLCIPLL